MRHDVNYTMLTDFYELTMANGYFQTGLQDRICYFDVFYRSVPDKGGFAICAGLDQLIDYILDLHLTGRTSNTSGAGTCFPKNFWPI